MRDRPHKYDRPNMSPAKCVRCDTMIVWRDSKDHYSNDNGVTWTTTRPPCRTIEYVLGTLAHNIVWAAQLGHSFHRGAIFGMSSMNKVCSQDPVGEFYPGCALDCPECELPRAKCICDEGRIDV